MTLQKFLLHLILFICLCENTLSIPHAETVKSNQNEILSKIHIDWQNWLVALRQNSNAVKELVSKSEDWRDLRGSGPFAGMTVVMLTTKMGSIEQLEIILARKPDLSTQDELGKTALHHLLERKGIFTGHLKKLLESGARTTHADVISYTLRQRRETRAHL